MRPSAHGQHPEDESPEALQARMERENFAGAGEIHPDARQVATKPKTPAQVLEELQAQLAERNLTELELEELLADPRTFLVRWRSLTDVEASEVVATVARLYFATLHRKAVDGEAFTEARLKQALIEARIRTLESLATHVQSGGPDLALKIAELVSKD